MRKIIHIDMDAFYASVEQRDNPELRGKPVIVGGYPASRGVVAACSYEARRYGIHSAMPSSRAYRLCPHAQFIRPRFNVYQKISEDIRKIFHDYTDLVEPLSLDEAYLDITDKIVDGCSATQIAENIRKQIFEMTGLTASAGVSFNKFLAKAASDFSKPNGIKVITPKMADDFIDNLPIGKFFGIGRVTEKKMIEMGIRSGKDLKKIDKQRLKLLFGKPGLYYYDIVRCIDSRPVNPIWIRKSYGKEITLKEDDDNTSQMIKILDNLAHEIVKLLHSEKKKGKTITLKIKYFDFKMITRSVTFSVAIRDKAKIMEHVTYLLQRTEAGKKKVRLLGISISNLESDDTESETITQLTLPFEVTK